MFPRKFFNFLLISKLNTQESNAAFDQIILLFADLIVHPEKRPAYFYSRITELTA